METNQNNLAAAECAAPYPALRPLPGGTYRLAPYHLTAEDRAELQHQDVLAVPAGLVLRAGAFNTLRLVGAGGALEQPLPVRGDADAYLLTREPITAPVELDLSQSDRWDVALVADQDPGHRGADWLVIAAASGGSRVEFLPLHRPDWAQLGDALTDAGVRYGALRAIVARPRLRPVAGRLLPNGVHLHVHERGSRRTLYARSATGNWYELLN